MYPDYGPAFGVPFLALNLVLTVGVYVWLALALSAVFRKAGVAPWKAWVPVLNVWTLFVLGGVAGWWSVVLIVLSGVPAVVAGIFAAIAVSNADSTLLLVGSLVAGVLGIAVVVISILVLVKVMRGVNAGFGLGTGHVVLGVLLAPVWASVVGWGSARWIGAPSGASRPPARPNPTSPDYPHPTPPPLPVPSNSFIAGAPVLPERPAAPSSAASFAPSSAPSPAPSPMPAPQGAHLPPPPAPLIQGNPWAPPPPPAAPSASVPDAASSPSGSPSPFPAVAPTAGSAGVAAPAEPLAPVHGVPADVISAPFGAVGAAVAAGAAGMPDDDDLDEHTVIATGRQPSWALELPSGRTVALHGATVVLGRNPAAPADAPDAQLIAVDDVSRTVSKTHAALRRTPAGWEITDLASTNGVFLPGAEGADVEVTAPVEINGPFLLGDALVTLRAEG